MSDEQQHKGIITRVNGPIVQATQMDLAGMHEVVEVGEMRLLGEVIKVRGEAATIQVYEEYAISFPRFIPWFIPERTRSNFLFSPR